MVISKLVNWGSDSWSGGREVKVKEMGKLNEVIKKHESI
jgi:hypothetical protein